MTKGPPPARELERYTTRRVVFVRPFTLGKAPDVFPPGIYEVETKEEAADSGSSTAYVRTGTMLIIPSRTGFSSRPVKGSDLDDALLRDAEHSGQSPPNENPDRGKSEAVGEAT